MQADMMKPKLDPANDRGPACSNLRCAARGHAPLRDALGEFDRGSRRGSKIRMFFLDCGKHAPHFVERLRKRLAREIERLRLWECLEGDATPGNGLQRGARKAQLARSVLDALVTVQGRSTDALLAGNGYMLDRLLSERSISVNTAAAGGNASLMTIG